VRPIIDMDSIAVLLTNACVHQCSNCTQCVGHFPKPYFMSFDDFKNSVDSLSGFSKMFGFHGGEPLLHPEFEKFCEYASSKIPKERLGLWTCLPAGREKYREIICNTFGSIFLNDHTREDILHAPVLVSSEEVGVDLWAKNYYIDHCWVQNSWSASINGNGAFFCEVAAALSLLLESKEESLGWNVKDNPTWWQKSPIDFTEQIKRYCKLCGCCLPMIKRASIEGVDDISPKMLERLKETSPKIKSGKYMVSDMVLKSDDRQMATYKDEQYRDKIAERYGIFLTINSLGYNQPLLRKSWEKQTDVDYDL
jgi:organic radical activating enzyme